MEATHPLDTKVGRLPRLAAKRALLRAIVAILLVMLGAVACWALRIRRPTASPSRVYVAWLDTHTVEVREWKDIGSRRSKIALDVSRPAHFTDADWSSFVSRVAKERRVPNMERSPFKLEDAAKPIQIAAGIASADWRRTVIVDEVGLPFGFLFGVWKYETEMVSPPGGYEIDAIEGSAWDATRSERPEVAPLPLPCQVRFVPLLANAGFAYSALATLSFLFRKIRSRVQRYRRRCEWCGYPTHARFNEDGPCSECGRLPSGAGDVGDQGQMGTSRK